VLFGCIGGFFYSYSVSVMIGLNALPELQAIEAMQRLNQGTRNLVFLFTFLVTPFIALGGVILLFLARRPLSGGLLLCAVIVYFLGSFLPTVNFNVTLNRTLEEHVPARISPTEAHVIWAEFHENWIYWNTVRAAMALIALLLSALAMYALPHRPQCRRSVSSKADTSRFHHPK
jgi:uncharacterized membrane protein